LPRAHFQTHDFTPSRFRPYYSGGVVGQGGRPSQGSVIRQEGARREGTRKQGTKGQGNKGPRDEGTRLGKGDQGLMKDARVD
jgi:hypothetical protein